MSSSSSTRTMKKAGKLALDNRADAAVADADDADAVADEFRN